MSESFPVFGDALLTGFLNRARRALRTRERADVGDTRGSCGCQRGGRWQEQRGLDDWAEDGFDDWIGLRYARRIVLSGRERLLRDFGLAGCRAVTREEEGRGRRGRFVGMRMWVWVWIVRSLVPRRRRGEEEEGKGDQTDWEVFVNEFSWTWTNGECGRWKSGNKAPRTRKPIPNSGIPFLRREEGGTYILGAS